MSELPTLPVPLRVHLAHATVQAIADQAQADILHIKGPRSTRRSGRRDAPAPTRTSSSAPPTSTSCSPACDATAGARSRGSTAPT